MEASQISIIEVLIISRLCALFGPRFLIISRMSSLVMWIVDNNLCVFFERTEGRSMFVFIREHFFPKEKKDFSAFFQRFLWTYQKLRRMEGIFYYLRMLLI